ncbi:extracellular solute-binding protein [Xylanimonas protaetiae]|uniref:Extracellular solute-binding protein n=1 Tax=Xylanimonas protaetiae TaxID=2509457 RepID=A0A4P6F3Y8_9MICO|nr:extracellular solute-binding protein [Xylanimonas protaetiae]QAY70264.1 extracellular solute-binding protein [Xylanimonas protaetiae]
MKRNTSAAIGLAAVAAMALTACSGGGDDDSTGGGATEAAGPVTLTVSGWSLKTTPEFQTLADAFHAKDPNVTIELKEYDPAQYTTLITADLAAGTAPDIVTQKEVKNVSVFQTGGQLMDVSDVVSKLSKDVNGTSSYEIDGKYYGVPYRQDSWMLFYNKDLFDKAGVAYPDGSWTWDDYAQAARDLTTGLKAAGSDALGTYQHSWQSTLQGFASAQTPDADILSGDFEYFAPYYDRVLKLVADGAQVDQGTITTNTLTYQAQFGKQKAAMMPMGSWYVATLIAQAKSGDADTFSWGFAPAPQLDKSTTGTDKTPVTFGDPTAFAINANIDKDKVAAAKEFLAFAASEEAGQALAKIGITPATTTDAVAQTYFAVDGAPTDDLSKFAWTTHKTNPENPTSSKTAATQTILNDMHTAIMTGSTPVDQAIKDAQDRFKSEVGS